MRFLRILYGNLLLHESITLNHLSNQSIFKNIRSCVFAIRSCIFTAWQTCLSAIFPRERPSSIRKYTFIGQNLQSGDEQNYNVMCRVVVPRIFWRNNSLRINHYDVIALFERRFVSRVEYLLLNTFVPSWLSLSLIGPKENTS